MEKNQRQIFIKDFERDLKLKISELKKEQQVFNTIGGLKTLMQEESQKDEIAVILDKLQAFAEKKIAEEIKVYEDILLELQKIEPNEKDIETTGLLA